MFDWALNMFPSRHYLELKTCTHYTNCNILQSALQYLTFYNKRS